MPFDLAALEFFAAIRTPALTALFSFITMLGSEVCAILLLCVFLWCVDKRVGIRLAFSVVLGLGINQSLKALCRVPRPWVRWPEVLPVEGALADATGFSFPSGHTAQAVALYGGLALSASKRWLRALCWVIALLVAVSRLYLGVHTLSDVAVSLLLGAALLTVVRFALNRMEQGLLRAEWLALAAAGLALGTLACAHFAAAADAVLAHDGYISGALMLGFAVGWYAEQRWVGYDPRMLLGARGKLALQLLVGVALVLGAQVALKAPLRALLPALPADMLRYASVSLYISLLHPLWVRRFLCRAPEHTAQA